jgi:PKD repeat protein
MKKLLILLLLISANITAQTTKILLVGNSYTAANNLASVISQLSLSMGDTAQVYAVNPGGYTFELHTVYAPTLSMIDSMDWDYVVLQEQSQRPSFPQSQVEVEVYPYARYLDSLIHVNNQCTETVFYMTWGRKYGDAGNCAFWPPVCTFTGMQEQLRDSYVKMADDNAALVAPVGEAWERSWNTDSTINLWVSDNSHPDVTGTYLAACVFYATIFRQSPVGASYTAGLSTPVASHLQQMAFQTVFDSLDTWNIGDYDVVAQFSSTANGLNVQFNNQSVNGTSYFWDFGDGNTSSDSLPQHIYSTSGIYQVNLIVSNGCTADTMTQAVNVTATSAVEHMGESSCINLLENGLFQTECASRLEVKIFTLEGKLVATDLIEPNGIFQAKVPGAGVYIAVFQMDNAVVNRIRFTSIR